MTEAVSSPTVHQIAPVALSSSAELLHHVIQGAVWMEKSEGGVNTAALSYAAFEFRLAVERFAIQLWASLSEGTQQQLDLRDMRSFKSIEGRIYELGGHQREVNRHFEFFAVISLLKIPMSVIPPDIGKLSRYWHTCSELCHVGWSFSCADSSAASEAARVLGKIQHFLLIQMHGMAGWPLIQGESFRALRDRFVAGQANADDVRAHFEKAGVWAKVEFRDGRPPQFAGEPIPPAASRSPDGQ